MDSKTRVLRSEAGDSEREIHCQVKVAAEGNKHGVMAAATKLKTEQPLADGCSNTSSLVSEAEDSERERR